MPNFLKKNRKQVSAPFLGFYLIHAPFPSLDRRRWVTMEEIGTTAARRRRSCKLGNDGHEVRLLDDSGDRHCSQGRWRKARLVGGFGKICGLKGINEVKLGLG